MKNWKMLVVSVLILGLFGFCLPLLPAHAGAGAGTGADASATPAPASATPAAPAVPLLIQKGFTAWGKNSANPNHDASWAFDVWKVGGLLERDNKPITLARYFARNDLNFGTFRSYELVSTKGISANSAVVYISLNFDRAAVYGRFVVYHTDKDWVVQDMDFSPKPEAIMPWLAFEGNTYEQ
jgi:hypothetical protein